MYCIAPKSYWRSMILLLIEVTLISSVVCFGSTTPPSKLKSSRYNKPINGQGQLETAKLWNTILPNQFYDTSETYNKHYRPPSEDDQPTIVDFSLIAFKITSFNFTSKKLRFTADLVREYMDTRLSYDPPTKLTKFIKVPCYTEVWTPRLRPLDVEFTHDPETDLAEVSETFVTPQGQVYRKVRFASEIIKHFEEIPEEMNNEMEKGSSTRDMDMTFSMRFVGDQETLEDLQFQWRANKPVSIETQVIRTSEGNWSIKPDVMKCNRTEDYGSFIGIREFTCIQLFIHLVSV